MFLSPFKMQISIKEREDCRVDAKEKHDMIDPRQRRKLIFFPLIHKAVSWYTRKYCRTYITDVHYVPVELNIFVSGVHSCLFSAY